MALRWTLAGEDDQLALFDPWGAAEPRRELPEVEYLHVRSRTIINTVPKASQMPFRHTINAYRGCAHACTYCFARPTHEYLGMDAGRDFERRIVVKVNAVELLKRELTAPAWQGETIAMGTNTDPYQQAEGRYRLTRGIVETLSEARNPFSILTKSSMIVRDAELLAAACKRTEVGVSFSIGTVDTDVWRATEPGTPPPARRLEALRRLTALGIRCSVLAAPILPGISDDPRAARGGGRRVPRGRCGVGHPDRAPPATRGARAVHALARGLPTRPRGRVRAHVPALLCPARGTRAHHDRPALPRMNNRCQARNIQAYY